MGLRHPFDTDAVYDLLDDGNVKITRGDEVAIFTGEGVYVSGDFREADPQFCNWVNNEPNPDTQLTTNRIAGRDGNAAKLASHLDS